MKTDWSGAKCEEASPWSGGVYLACGAPALYLVKHIGRREGPYLMCMPCAHHNVHNRNAEVLAQAPDSPVIEKR